MSGQSASVLVGEAPVEHSFKLYKTGIEIKSIQELADALEIMSDESYSYHVTDTRNDFATWVQEVFHDQELSARLRSARDRSQAYQASRQRAKLNSGNAHPTAENAALVFGFNMWDVIVGFIGGLIIGVFVGAYLL